MIVVLVDDAGFGNPRAFGGPINTPNLDRLADGGLRFNRFHVTALCSPSRAALLSGRNQHAIGFGSIAELAGGWPGYNAHWPRSAASIATILTGNGYATAAFGKWHLTPASAWGPDGPFDRWPTGLGFDYFWGFLGGDTDQYEPLLFENRKVLGSPTEKNFYLNTALADRAIDWMRKQKSVAPEQPFFIYFATGASHAPHQVPGAWSDKYKGKFDAGWDAYRETAFARQKELGVIPPDTKLTPRNPAFPAWDPVPDDQKKLFARQMEVYAGFQENTDHEVGRVLAETQSLGVSDNTLVIYIWGDNGASMEGAEVGTFNEMTMQNGIPLTAPQQLALIQKYGGLEAWGGPNMDPHYACAWAWAGNTPFQWGKQIASHLGGTRDAMVVSWPARIKDKGGLRSQFTHLIDVVPTILEATKIPAPAKVDGVAQMPMHGTSFVYTFDDARAKERHTQQYFEVLGNRAMYKEGWWLASRMPRIPWKVDAKEMAKFAPGKWDPDKDPVELYNLEADFSQADNLAAKYPQKVRELTDLWWAEAKKYQVEPLLGGLAFYYGFEGPRTGRNKLVYYPGTENLSPDVAPRSLQPFVVDDCRPGGARRGRRRRDRRRGRLPGGLFAVRAARQAGLHLQHDGHPVDDDHLDGALAEGGRAAAVRVRRRSARHVGHRRHEPVVHQQRAGGRRQIGAHRGAAVQRLCGLRHWQGQRRAGRAHGRVSREGAVPVWRHDQAGRVRPEVGG